MKKGKHCIVFLGALTISSCSSDYVVSSKAVDLIKSHRSPEEHKAIGVASIAVPDDAIHQIHSSPEEHKAIGVASGVASIAVPDDAIHQIHSSPEEHKAIGVASGVTSIAAPGGATHQIHSSEVKKMESE